MQGLISILTSLALVSGVGALLPGKTVPEGTGLPKINTSSGVSDAFVPEVRAAPARQVKIEQRVIIRIAPARRSAAPNSLVPRTTRTANVTLVKDGATACVAQEKIRSGRPTGKGLVLFLKNREMVGLELERSCRTEAFYSGFFVERTKDGLLCRARDKVHSRAGTKCAIRSIDRLTPVVRE